MADVIYASNVAGASKRMRDMGDGTVADIAVIQTFLGDSMSTWGPFQATTTNANAPIPNAAGRQVRIVNSGSVGVRIAFGTSSSAAATVPTPGALTGSTYASPTAGSKLIMPGATEVLGVPVGSTHVAFKTDTGTTTVEFTTGLGA